MNNKEKVRLLKQYNAVSHQNSKVWWEWYCQRENTRIAHTMLRVFGEKTERLVLPPEPEDDPLPNINGLTCGATTRAGTPCKLTTIFSNGRCKFHGGLSTGAKTKAGRKRQRAGYRAWLEKQRASKAGRKRTRTYTSDVIRIDGATLKEISIRAPESDLRPVHGIALTFSGSHTLTASHPGGEPQTIALTTTSTQFGGVRWWYVCPECKTRKAALYLSGISLCCRQCAGIHYASQSK